jgi:hypothetical protein
MDNNPTTVGIGPARLEDASSESRPCNSEQGEEKIV